MNSIPVKRSNRGFTLIELLVVIAIIAILAAILFPVFARARENARRASCQSNEKNIALGFKQYIQDNGEKYPPAMPQATILKASGSTGALSEYIKSSAIFYCPSDSDKVSGSYGYVLTGAPNESAIANSDTEKLLNETGLRHFEGQNIAYVDGHVKWSKGGTTATAFLSTTATGSYPSGVSTFIIEFSSDNAGAPNYTQPNLESCSPATPCSVGSGLYQVYFKVDNTSGANTTLSASMTTAGTPATKNVGAFNNGSQANSNFPQLDNTQKIGANKDFTISFTVGSDTKTYHFRTGA